MTDVTQNLSQIESGDPFAAEKFLPLVYEELRRLAAARLVREQPGQTLQATSLVREAYIRLVDAEESQHWNSRGHFFGAAAEAMRTLLVDQARRKHSHKRGGQGHRVPLDEADVGLVAPAAELLDIDEALTRLAAEGLNDARRIAKRREGGVC